MNSHSLDAEALAPVVWPAYAYMSRAALKTFALLKHISFMLFFQLGNFF